MGEAVASARPSDTRGPAPRCNAACFTPAPTSAPYLARARATRRPGSCCAWPRNSRVSRPATPWPLGWAPTTHGGLRHKDFLEQKSIWSDGSENDLHQRLVKARDTMRRRIREHTMFTFMDPGLGIGTPGRPPTTPSNQSTHASARYPWNHRGLCLICWIKAVCWWCHQHTERPETWHSSPGAHGATRRSNDSTDRHGSTATKDNRHYSTSPPDTEPVSTGTNSAPTHHGKASTSQTHFWPITPGKTLGPCPGT